MKKNRFESYGALVNASICATLIKQTERFVIEEHVNLGFGYEIPNQKLDINGYFTSKAQLKTPFKPKANLIK